MQNVLVEIPAVGMTRLVTAFRMASWAAVLMMASVSWADISNGSFESGFTDWTLTANNSGKFAGNEVVTGVGTVVPQQGANMAKITLGKVGSDLIDFNLLHSSSATVSSGNHVQCKVKILYNNLRQFTSGGVLEVILKAPMAGQPLIAALEIELINGTKSRVTNILTGTTSEVAIIDSGPSGFAHETAWLTIDVDVSSLAGTTSPISFFMAGGNIVADNETMVYLIDDVKLATPVTTSEE